MRIRDWSSYVCSADLRLALVADIAANQAKNGGLVAHQKLAIRVLPAAKRERREIAVAIVRQAVRHLASAVSALTTTLSNIAACLASRTLRIAKRWRSVSFCNSPITSRSEEHTSELQSLMRISYAVFCLKKKKKPH